MENSLEGQAWSRERAGACVVVEGAMGMAWTRERQWRCRAVVGSRMYFGGRAQDLLRVWTWG